VEYIKPEAAQQAIKELNGKMVGSARIVVEEARPRLEEGGLTIPRIYVGHLSSSIKKSDLYYLFHKYGDIVEVMIKDDFAFIEYTNLHSAYKAMTELNGYRLGGCKLQIEEAKPRMVRTTMSSTSGTEQTCSLPPKCKYYLSFREMDENGNLKPKKRRRASPRRSLTRSRSRSQDRD
jgi:RNA recognition motif-containing protein